ncbi:MAG: pseudouridine-5'-phosphate glycosidase [Spirochaetales bacterium]|nr:MAG: pseudouridine-5'-phosphate glycosidase [Spirochaetales bacterium]
MRTYLDFSPEVRTALDENRPVVALESTIISHGMPYPANIQTAQEVECIVKESGAVPATMAVIGGRIKAGLGAEDMKFLAQEKHVIKASRMDLAVVIAGKCHASTTVAATMICADLAGIRVFVTGGIGGVHRGAEKTFDISADLQELSRTDVTVVCSGAKAILDLRLTMEYLETLGVPALGFGTDELPAFYSRHSGIKLAYRVDSAAEIARIMKTKWDLGLSGGILVANPIPEADSMDPAHINSIIDKALEACEDKSVRGKDVTPFLLSKVKELSKGESLESNIALIKNNAALGAKIAVEYAKLLQSV